MKPRFIVTVDTETFRVDGQALPFEAHLYADTPGGSFGVTRVMELCSRYGVTATFFVDVYMHREYGEDKVADLCQRIERAGHDVQLHAHPSWIDNRLALISDVPLNRQIEILAEGKHLIEKWTGRSAVGFRAGAYGASIETIRALKATGFRVDSSYFPLHPNCKLSEELGHRCVNRPFCIEGLLEIPVTTYWLWNSSSQRKNSKIDVNACSWAELRDVVAQLAHSSIEYVILFAHSFSFLRLDGSRRRIVPHHAPLRRFEALIRMIREELDGEFTTIQEIASTPGPASSLEPDLIPAVSPLKLLPRVMARFF